MRKACVALLILTAACAPVPHEAAEAPKALRKPDVRYEPTPQAVVEEMLELANVGPGDIVYDLGSGDGRIPITAARRYGARGVGIDIDPQRIAESNANAKKARVTGRVRFRNEDLFQADIGDATVVTLFLYPDLNMKLRPKLLAELKPGTRIVSYWHDMGNWRAERRVNTPRAPIYLWTVPAR